MLTGETVSLRFLSRIAKTRPGHVSKPWRVNPPIPKTAGLGVARYHEEALRAIPGRLPAVCPHGPAVIRNWPSCKRCPTSVCVPSLSSSAACEKGAKDCSVLVSYLLTQAPCSLTLNMCRGRPCSFPESQACMGMRPRVTGISQRQATRKATAPWQEAENLRKQQLSARLRVFSPLRGKMCIPLPRAFE